MASPSSSIHQRQNPSAKPRGESFATRACVFLRNRPWSCRAKQLTFAAIVSRSTCPVERSLPYGPAHPVCICVYGTSRVPRAPSLARPICAIRSDASSAATDGSRGPARRVLSATAAGPGSGTTPVKSGLIKSGHNLLTATADGRQQQMPWRSPAPAATTARQPVDTDSQIGPVGQSPPTEYNDRLSWVVPSSRYTVATTSGIAPIAATSVPSAHRVVVVSDPLDPYRPVDACCVPETIVQGVPVPVPQSVTVSPSGQIVSYGPPQVVNNSPYPVAPPRIRGFMNSGVSRIRIPAGLSVVSDRVVQTADSSWKSRTSGDSIDTRSRY